MSAETSAEDRVWMGRALDLARRGEGRVSPNPLVGAVIVKAGKLLGEGWHGRFGGPHAEVEAIAVARSQARGATLYVTLEPCSHHGKTPPCVGAVHQAGIERVVAAVQDPNPLVGGRGLRELRKLGVAVSCGLLRSEAKRLNASYFKHILTGFPLVTWKSAATLDGRIATASGESRWITGRPARSEAQQLRLWADAVLVGAQTAVVDDPRLQLRLPGARDKRLLRVVLDGRLRLRSDARLLRGRPEDVVVYTRRNASSKRVSELRGLGAEVVRVSTDSRRRLDLRSVLKDLSRRGVGRLLVEGGGQTAASFLEQGLVDRLVMMLAPRVLGATGIPVVGQLPSVPLGEEPAFRVSAVRRLGRDVVIEAEASAAAGRVARG